MSGPRAPTKVRVAGKVYTLEPTKPNDLGSDRSGQARHTELRIIYDASWALAQQHDTVLHEIIHCCEWSASLDLKESEVHALASQLYGVLRDNPQLVKWLTN